MENKQNIKDLIQKFYPHAKEKLGFDHPVRVIMRQDAENAQQSLGKTAYYDPAEKIIVLYVTNRHPKDVLRSFSHELVHHAQNCRGELDDLSTDGHYAKDGKGREIEAEAYLQGNFNLRDYEDNKRHEGVNEMKLTKSQLKGFIEAAVKQISEGKMSDENNDGIPDFAQDGEGSNDLGKAKDLDEESQQMDMNAIANVIEELRQLSDMDSSASRNLQRMGQEQFFRVLSDKLENAMSDQVASTGTSAELEEGDVDEMHCGGKRDDVDEEKVPGRKTFKVSPKGPDSLDQAKMDAETAASGDEGAEKFLDKMIAKKVGAGKNRAVALPKGPKLEENNDTWYNSSLYESLMSKWTK